MTIAAGLRELRDAPMPPPQSCADCGKAGEHGTVLLTMVQTVKGKVHEWRLCSRCWIKRGKD